MANNEGLSNEELSDYFQASAQTYGFLAKTLFKELNEAAIDELAAAEWPKDTGDALLDRGCAHLRRYFKFSSGDRRTQLAVEYARVFLAAGVFGDGRRTAVPYESVFTSPEHTMMGDSRDDVVRRFARDGFKVDPALHEPEDHLSFELEYLAHMSTRALADMQLDDGAKLAEDVRRQAEFIDGHLLNWIGELREVAEEYAKTTFYIGILEVAEGALRQSREVLGSWEESRAA